MICYLSMMGIWVGGFFVGAGACMMFMSRLIRARFRPNLTKTNIEEAVESLADYGILSRSRAVEATYTLCIALGVKE